MIVSDLFQFRPYTKFLHQRLEGIKIAFAFMNRECLRTIFSQVILKHSFLIADYRTVNDM